MNDCTTLRGKPTTNTTRPASTSTAKAHDASAATTTHAAAQAGTAGRPNFTAPGDATKAHDHATGAHRVKHPSGTVANSSSVAVRLRPPPPTSAALPVVDGAADTVATLGDGVSVVRGKDPGNYYCEHAVFTTTTEAMKPGSSIVKNAEGEPLTGFLHNPSDEFTDGSVACTDQAARHGDRRSVVGDAIRGYYEEAKAALAPDAPFRMLLTGYDAFMSVVNNPTGDFVAHQENVDAAMQSGFGSALTTPVGAVKASAGDATTLEYKIIDPDGGASRSILVQAVKLPVSDAAIDGGPQSLQSLIASFQPNACLSMGVDASSPSFQAEWHSDDGGLVVKNGHQMHDDSQAPVHNNPDNFSLARAIGIGAAESRLT